MSRYPNAAFEHYWQMWNAPDLETARGHLDQAVTEEFIFCDPIEWHTGRDALAANVRRFRWRFPGASFELRSGFDHHHNRYRYRWDMLDADGVVVVEGTDIATVAEGGLIERIDGFFGPLPGLEA